MTIAVDPRSLQRGPTTGETAAIAGSAPIPRRRIGSSDIRVVPLALSGKVFGWTADSLVTEEILDVFRGRGRRLPRHRGFLRGRSQRDHDRQLDEGPAQPRRDGHRHQDRQERRPSRAVRDGDRRGHRGVASPPAHRPHRPALPAHRRPARSSSTRPCSRSTTSSAPARCAPSADPTTPATASSRPASPAPSWASRPWSRCRTNTT